MNNIIEDDEGRDSSVDTIRRPAGPDATRLTCILLALFLTIG